MWVEDKDGISQYNYSPKMLMVIADNYSLYNPESEDFDTLHWQEAVEYKADFDRALSHLTHRQKRVIWAKDDDYYYLERLGYYNVASYRHLSFSQMAEYLNGGQGE